MGALESALDDAVEQCPQPEAEPWCAYQGNRFVEHEQLAKLLARTWGLDRHESEAWRVADLEAIATKAGGIDDGLPPSAVEQLWRGVSDVSKKVVWPVASGTAGIDRRFRAEVAVDRLQRDLVHAFGEHVPESFECCPTFGGGFGNYSGERNSNHSLEQVVPFMHLLAPAGKAAAQKLLWCCQQLRSVDFCPVLPILVCMLLVFLPSEADVYMVFLSVLQRAEEDANIRSRADAWTKRQQAPFEFLPLTKRSWGDLAAKAVSLLQSHMYTEVAHLASLGVDLEEETLHCLVDGLASRLPFRALCRVYGVFLAQGSEVFVRFLVALWLSHRTFLFNSTSAEVALQVLRYQGSASGVLEKPSGGGLQLGVDDLSELARSLSLPRSLQFLKSADLSPECLRSSEDTGHSSLEIASLGFYPRVRGASRFVWDSLWPSLWQWLPPIHRIRDPVLIFASYRDGYTFSGVMHKCEQEDAQSPTLLACHVRKADSVVAVIGTFIPGMLRPTGGGYLSADNFRRSGIEVDTSYVFSAVGTEKGHCAPQVWFWSGRNDLLYMANSLDGGSLAIGGGGAPAIRVDGELLRGSTGPCATFNSPALLDKVTSSKSAFSAVPEETNEPPLSTSDIIDFDVLSVEVYKLVLL